MPAPKVVQTRLDKLGARYEEAPAWRGDLKGEVKDWATRRGIESVSVPLFWSGKKERPEPGQRGDVRLLISLHGGGYAGNSAHPDDVTSFLPLTVATPSKTVDVYCAVDYRLSSLPPGAGKSTNPFPTALVDSITAFKHFIALGYQSHNVFILGDSAGGNLVMALARYLLYEEQVKLGGIILLSAWLDVSGSHSNPGISRFDNKKADYLGDEVEPGSYDYLAFLGGPEDCMSPEMAYISPSCRNIEPEFEGFPRTFISVGDNEQFLDEGKMLADRMRRYLSREQVVLDITPAVPHDFALLRQVPHIGLLSFLTIGQSL
ncbi:alpha/beta-hydrolase [Calocera cornea HHB12733]|uniref:Alpha/beta-hydrolase n=1 Tax=Calocera cornea HHB12733 TaxID=1353952 RepID=A0A165CFP8_9BASI|nr:alpha/beta-hydrolase [Calocera cornea HHB12733]